MAPLLPNSTKRIWLDYTSLGRAHQLLFRVSALVSDAECQQFAADVASICALRMLATDGFIGLRRSNQFSQFTVPLPFTPVPGVVSGAFVTWENDPESAMLSLPGRGFTSGRNVLYCLFSPVKTASWPNDNRYQPGNEAVIDTWRSNMTALILGANTPGINPLTIGGDEVVPYNYVNISHNAYWQRKQRRGG